MNPYLTIIIPTFNSKATLPQALESVLRQTFLDYEILIIDNNSTDGTIDLVKDFTSVHPNIRWISEPDKGIYDAMNKGTKMAKGEWIYFLGSDDRLLDTNVLRNVFIPELFNRHDIIYGNVISSRFNGRYDFEFSQEKILTKNICHQAIFFKKSIFLKTGRFNLKYKFCADWDHNMKWLLNPNIRSIFVALDIAEYADGGFSSKNPDLLFEDDKTYNYFTYGYKTIPFIIAKKLFKKLLKSNFSRGNFKRIFNLFFLLIANSFLRCRN